MAEISFSVQIIPENSQKIGIDSTASATKYLQKILQEFKDPTGEKIDLSKHKILIAYQLLSPEVSVEQLMPHEKKELTPESTFSDIGVDAGYHILFVKPPTVSSKLKLEISGQKRIVEKQLFRVGRTDSRKGIIPDLDLTPFLGTMAKKVSRKLFSFVEEQGKWAIKLDTNARTVVFLGGTRLSHGIDHEIEGASVISIGGSPDNAYQKITINLLND